MGSNREMLETLGKLAISGSYKVVNSLNNLLDDLIKRKGEDFKVSFPQTGYYLPLIYALLGKEITNLREAKDVLGDIKSFLREVPQNSWDSLLKDATDSGVASALSAELIEAIKYAEGDLPEEGWQGFIPDSVLRSLGIQLVDGRISGVAVILGAAPDSKIAATLIRELQEKNILSLLAGSVNKKNFRDQLIRENVQVGLDHYIVPLGSQTSSVIHAVNFAIRASLSYGGNKKGETQKNIDYCKKRVPAFVLALGELDDIKVAVAFAAIRLGFPVITDQDVPEIRETPFTSHEALLSEKNYSKIVSLALLARDIKVKIRNIPIPVAYSAAFEGERVRREQMYCQFGGKYSTAFEFLRSRSLEEVEDGKVEIIGSEIDSCPEGGNMPLGILVEVAGRKMQKDFEPILERQIHTFLNEAMGIFHMGQRNTCWIRISKDAFNKGFRLRHFGVILHARLHDTFSKIVDRVQVKIYTNQGDVEKILEEAKKAYQERDERMAGMTDESVDVFYSCVLCQSFAPNHVCIVKPERLGLCGAYTWLDAKASYELNPTGPNQPVKKGECLDPVRGEWKGVNEFIYQKSNKTLERFHAYSILTWPETSCCVGDTQIIINDKPIKIGEFINRYRGTEEYTKFQALTLGNGKNIREKIIAMQKFPAPEELVKIKTKSGLELILTRDHKVSVDRAEGIVWVRADQIREGDRVLALKRLKINSKLPDIFDIIPGCCRIRDREIIGYLKKELREKYGRLSKALRKLSIPNFKNNSLPISTMRTVINNLDSTGRLWNEVKGEVKRVYKGWSYIDISNRILNNDLFYILGLLASDGSICRIGKGEYKINFINTEKTLVSVYKSLLQNLFPDRNVKIRLKGSSASFIKGRRIKAKKICYDCYTNNFILGAIADYFGIKVGLKGKWNLGKMVNLPENFITSFLAGIFDGDGSIRLRKYGSRWNVAEAYLCIEDREAAIHLQLLLKRFGIIGYLKKSGSIYKVVLYGKNLIDFLNLIPIRHPQKKIVSNKIKELSSLQEIDKTQREVLPFRIGRLLAEISGSESVLSSSALFYYKTCRSRPLLSNVSKVLDLLPEERTEEVRNLIDRDYFLDIVKEAKIFKNQGQFDYVYNLTLSHTHSYYANGIHIANCGCFECIVAILPEANGFMIVNREYSGMTPCGMTFSTLAGSVGGGAQTPGFMGIGKLYIVSKKFISADGGLKRIVWMPKELKEELGERLKKRCAEEGLPDLIDKIADETSATTAEELVEYLQKVNHPALEMPPLI